MLSNDCIRSHDRRMGKWTKRFRMVEPGPRSNGRAGASWTFGPALLPRRCTCAGSVGVAVWSYSAARRTSPQAHPVRFRRPETCRHMRSSKAPRWILFCLKSMPKPKPQTIPGTRFAHRTPDRKSPPLLPITNTPIWIYPVFSGLSIGVPLGRFLINSKGSQLGCPPS